LDERSDIFSLGILFYLISTGHHPFLRDSSADVISAILSSDPPPVTDIKLEMPRHLGRVIRHCLEKDPSLRFHTALDVRNELEQLREEVSLGGAPNSSGSLFPIEPRSRTIPWRSLALAAATVVTILVGIMIVRGCTRPLADLKTIALLPFSNLTGDPANDHLGEVFSSGLMDRLSSIYGVQLVSRSEVAALVREGVSAAEIGRELGAGSVIEGEILREGPQMRVVVSLTDSATKFVLWSEPYTSSASAVYGLEDDAARDLESFLSIPLSARERRQLQTDRPALTRAYAHFVRGRRFLVPGLEDPRGAESAADNFRQAIRLHPEMTIARAALSEALWQLYHVDRDPEILERAREQALVALQEDKELPAAHVALARVERSSGEFDASINSLQAAARGHPNPDQVYRELAESYERVGELELAEDHYRTATSLDDNDWLNWNRLGALLFRLGRLEEARTAFETALGLAPEGIYRPLENLGTTYLYMAEFDQAIEIYEKIPGPLPYALHATNLATAYFFKGDMDKAVENFALAVELDPKEAELRRNHGDALLRIGDPEAAEAEYRNAVALMDEALAVTPDNRDLLRRRAMYRAKAGDCETAVSEADELNESPPKTASGGHEFAYIYSLCGTREAALSAVREAIELGVVPQLLAQEDEFVSLRNDPEFQALTQGDVARPN
jgi:Flp pilus assembly protein TadD/TolB-like protein